MTPLRVVTGRRDFLPAWRCAREPGKAYPWMKAPTWRCRAFSILTLITLNLGTAPNCSTCSESRSPIWQISGLNNARHAIRSGH